MAAGKVRFVYFILLLICFLALGSLLLERRRWKMDRLHKSRIPWFPIIGDLLHSPSTVCSSNVSHASHKTSSFPLICLGLGQGVHKGCLWVC